MIKIFGSPQSSSGRCFWTLEEVEAPYEAVKVDFKSKEHKAEEYLEINPNGKVPALVDGDIKVWESVAINFYLADKYKPELLGKDLNARTLVRQWSIWAMTDVQPPLVEMLIEKFFVPDERKNPEVNERCLKKLTPFLEVINNHMAKQDYLVDNVFTLADLNLVSVVEITHPTGVDLSAYPNIQSWYKRVAESPSYGKYRALARG